MSESLFAALPSTVRATGERAIREMRLFGEGMVDGAEMRCPREYMRSVAALHDHLRVALLTVDSMLTAGASAGSIRSVIEEALGDRDAALLDAKQADDEIERARLR